MLYIQKNAIHISMTSLETFFISLFFRGTFFFSVAAVNLQIQKKRTKEIVCPCHVCRLSSSIYGSSTLLFELEYIFSIDFRVTLIIMNFFSCILSFVLSLKSTYILSVLILEAKHLRNLKSLFDFYEVKRGSVRDGQ